MTYSNYNLNTMMKEPCKCGQVQAVYHPDENQYEPACWECYYNDLSVDVPTEFWEPRKPSADELEDELPF